MRPTTTNDAPASPDKPDIRPVQTFYPDAVNRETAAPVLVRTAQDMPGIDIHLRSAQTYHVRGKIAGNLPEGGPDKLNLTIAARDDLPMFFGGRNVAKDGTFDIPGVAPGAYTLSLVSMNGRLNGFAHQPIDVGTSDLNGVVMTIVPPGTLHGQVYVEGKPTSAGAEGDLASVGLYFSPADGFFYGAPEVTVKGNYAFAAENVNPGKYLIHVANTPEGTYIKSIQFGHQEVFGKELDLTQGVAGELAVVLRYGTAEVSGTLQKPQTDPAAASTGQATAPPPSASIVLIADNSGTDTPEMSFANSDQNGTFNLKHVRPGRYRAYALEQLDMNQWQNPAVRKQFESRAAEIELNENDKKQIQLSVISSADTQQMLASLGIESQ